MALPEMKHGQIKELENGEYEFTAETGETFRGHPLDIAAKALDAKVETRRHYESQLEQAKAAAYQPPPPPEPAAVPYQPDGAVRWVWTEAAKDPEFWNAIARKEGFENWDARQRALGEVRQVTENTRNTDMAGAFLYVCPEFPNTPDAIDKLDAKVQQNGWDYTPPNLIAAHHICVKEGVYQPLTTDEQNMAANARSGGSVPPPPPPQGSVDNRGAPESEYTMDLGKLREMVLKGGK